MLHSIPQFPTAAIDEAAESRRLAADAASAATAPRLAAMRATRAALPTAAARPAVLEQLREHAVLVISGATGRACWCICA